MLFSTLLRSSARPPRARLTALAFLLTAVLAGPGASPALAQSQGDLRRENQRLQTETEDLQRELTAAHAAIAKLQAEIADLRRLIAAGGAAGDAGAAAEPAAAPPATMPGPPADVVTIDETTPHASPRSLYSAIVSDYTTATAGAESGAEPDSPERIAYMRKIRHWATGVNRTFKNHVNWHVTMIDRPERVGRGYVIRMTAVDPKSKTQLGDPFPVFVSRAIVGRLKQIEERFGLGEVMVLKGALEPQVWINESRTSEGPFNNPRYIGLFAEFGFNVTAASLLPAPVDADRGSDRGSDRKSSRSGESSRDSSRDSDHRSASARDSSSSSDSNSSRDSSSSRDASSSRKSSSSSSNKSSRGGG